ncbi:uncharacterized abhydrolase domain-containing protein DDB_G0269086-like [Chenopodium quinoa]|uniref:uncharacterized abhydrolase domain-containing protein DDB_G0269086-like n=1 Tax=Chenopodium quinoa TaxID=63459 RepID=UPI000B78F9F5|nr:uncharacterized abhydrolase domain-containing protein DDB_G0269086-like [Chenopodium quinoa]
MTHFGRSPSQGATGRMANVPSVWLPCCHYIFQEKILVVVDLSQKFQNEVCEEYSSVNYRVLRISQEKDTLTNKLKIANTQDRPLSLVEKRLQIVSAAEYQAQKLWFKKVNPYFLHSAEEQVAATIAAEASRSGVGPSIPAAEPKAGGEEVEEEEDSEDARLLKTSSDEEEENTGEPIEAAQVESTSDESSSDEEMSGPKRRRVVLLPRQLRAAPKEADTLIIHPEDDDVQTLGEIPKDFNAEGLKETEKKVEDAKNFDMPSTSAGISFKTFQSVKMGFESARLLVVLDAARNALRSHRASAIEFFGDLSSLSDLEKAKIWSLRAVAWVVHNHYLVVEMNEELKFKLKDVELRANIVGLKREAAEEEATAAKAEADRLQRNADIVLQDLEQHIFPLMDQGGEEAAKTQAELKAAQKLLEFRVYTQEQNEEGFENGFKVARRLAFHVDPAINWELAEAWSMDPQDVHMNEASPAETIFLAHQAKAEAREQEEAERLEREEAKKRESERTLTQPVSSFADAEASRSPSIAAQPDHVNAEA